MKFTATMMIVFGLLAGCGNSNLTEAEARRLIEASPLPRLDPPLLARIGPPAGGVVDVIALPVACSR